jgi:hypothetical protein
VIPILKHNPKKLAALFTKEVIMANSKNLGDAEKILKDMVTFVVNIDCGEPICRDFEVNLTKILQLMALCPSENDFKSTLDDIIGAKQ